ncbi:MAG: hypothetical protein CSYNP_03121 [Syntrophus sp. SKADARSKE-3]|nr:hypothetical protein [Syntrophus sp. SKADARSKE-3]
MSALVTKFVEGFQPRYQDVLWKTLVARVVTNFALKSDLKYGAKVRRPILTTDFTVEDVVRYVDRTMQTFSDDEEYIEIDKQKGVDTKIDDWDKLQAGPLQTGEVIGERAAKKLKQYMDADAFYETVNAYDTFDDGDIAGTDGNPITLAAGTSGNVGKTFANLLAKLTAHDVESDNLVAVVDPFHAAIINQDLIGKNTQLADLTFKNGYAGPVVGFSMFISNNLTGQVNLKVGTNPTAGDTVTIAGVVFTFVASPSAAGDVDIGGSAAVSVDNLVAAINGGAGAGTAYVEVSAANRKTLSKIKRITAVDNTTYITIYGKGAGRLSYSETLTAAGDVFEKHLVHCYVGRRGMIDMIAQQDVKPDVRPEPKQKTNNILTDSLYGVKTFTDSKQNFLDLQMI